MNKPQNNNNNNNLNQSILNSLIKKQNTKGQVEVDDKRELRNSLLGLFKTLPGQNGT